MKVGVILPSRGLIFSKTADEILGNLKNVPHKIFFSHGKPIPDCFEKPVERALKDKSITHLWFVEDDMILYPETLMRLVETDKAVVVVDYPVTEDGKGAVFSVKGEVIFSGTGCTLVKREVFDELKKPYFRTDICWNIKNYGDLIKLTGVPRGQVKDGYGLHDVNFFISIKQRGIPIHLADFKAGQRKLKAWGKAGTNDGAHQIREWRKIKKDYLLNQVKQWPIEPKGELVTVLTDTGEILVSESHAKTLIDKGLATNPPKKAVIIDDSEVL